MRIPLTLPKTARPTSREGAVARLAPWIALSAIVAVALSMRLYRLDGLVTYYPDSYAQLRSVDNVLHGHFPPSYLYPPGIGLVLAPFFMVLPNTLVAMQGVILVAGMALVLVAYGWSVAGTSDRRAALLFATAVAVSASFVYYSRATLFDVVNTLLIAIVLITASSIARRDSVALIGFGALVFATVTVRFTNLALLPVLFAASMPNIRGVRAMDILDHAVSRPVLIVAGTIAAIYATYVAVSIDTITRFTNSRAGSIIEVSGYVSRLARYVQAELTGYGDSFAWQDGIAMIAMASFAAIGARRLWSTNRKLLVPLVMLIVLWPPVHAFYNVFAGRYMMPAFFCVLLLASYGLSIATSWQRERPDVAQRVATALVLALGVTFFMGRQLTLDASFTNRWPADVVNGREVAYSDIRDELRSIDGDHAALISSQALAVDRTNRDIDTLDLIEHSETYGINADSIARLESYVRERQSAGETVYYHYTEFEDVGARFKKYELGFDAYFEAIDRDFTVRELVRAEATNRVQRLYMIEAR